MRKEHQRQQQALVACIVKEYSHSCVAYHTYAARQSACLLRLDPPDATGAGTHLTYWHAKPSLYARLLACNNFEMSLAMQRMSLRVILIRPAR